MIDLNTWLTKTNFDLDELGMLMFFLNHPRRIGTTHAVVRGAIDTDALLIVSDRKQAQYVIDIGVPKRNVILLSNLRALNGIAKPILADHNVIHRMVVCVLSASKKKNEIINLQAEVLDRIQPKPGSTIIVCKPGCPTAELSQRIGFDIQKTKDKVQGVINEH